MRRLISEKQLTNLQNNNVFPFADINGLYDYQGKPQDLALSDSDLYFAEKNEMGAGFIITYFNVNTGVSYDMGTLDFKNNVTGEADMRIMLFDTRDDSLNPKNGFPVSIGKRTPTEDDDYVYTATKSVLVGSFERSMVPADNEFYFIGSFGGLSGIASPEDYENYYNGDGMNPWLVAEYWDDTYITYNISEANGGVPYTHNGSKIKNVFVNVKSKEDIFNKIAALFPGKTEKELKQKIGWDHVFYFIPRTFKNIDF